MTPGIILAALSVMVADFGAIFGSPADRLILGLTRLWSCGCGIQQAGSSPGGVRLQLLFIEVAVRFHWG